jgi:hypothetical protein
VIAVTAIPPQQQQPRRRMKWNERVRVLTKTMSNSEEKKKEEDPIRTQMEREARVETLD